MKERRSARGSDSGRTDQRYSRSAGAMEMATDWG